MGMERRKLAKVLVDAATGAGAKVRLRNDGVCVRRRRHGRRRHLSRRRDRSLRPGDRCRRRSIQGAIDDRHRHRARADRHGHLPRLHEPARVDHAGPISASPARATSPGSVRPGEDSLYAYLVEPKQDRSDMLPEDRLAHMRQLAEALPRTVGRHPRADDRSEHRPLHLVREDAAGTPVVAGPGRPHRRRRPHLSADGRPGRGAGDGGRDW